MSLREAVKLLYRGMRRNPGKLRAKAEGNSFPGHFFHIVTSQWSLKGFVFWAYTRPRLWPLSRDRGIFIVPNLQCCDTGPQFKRSLSEDLLINLVASYDKPGVLRACSNLGPYCITYPEKDCLFNGLLKFTAYQS